MSEPDAKSPEPFFIAKATGKDLSTPENHPRHWVNRQVAAARVAGAKHVRVSWTPAAATPTLVVVEGWHERPENEGEPRFDAEPRP